MGKSSKEKSTKKKEFKTLDFETDPFVFGQIPQPFAVCIFDGFENFLLWAETKTLIEKTVEYLRSLEKCYIYAHNGGRFDFHYLIDFCDGEISVINGRIATMQIGDVTLIDSYLLIPVALGEYKKDTVDYKKFERGARDKHRDEITRYLLNDCKYLHELISGFKGLIGDVLTIGQGAFKQIRATGYKIPRCDEKHDDFMRPYYIGGRCEAFQKGIFKGEFTYLDINSAYPWAMLDNHASGPVYSQSKTLPSVAGSWFARITARSAGCLPIRTKEGLLYPHDTQPREYFATGWEIAAGLDTGALKIETIKTVLIPKVKQSFADYVYKFFELRKQAKKDGDELHSLAYKLLLNSGYGKFCSDPRKYKKYLLSTFDEYPGDEYDKEADFGGKSLWSKPDYRGHGFYDVATGSSITGKVRAHLWASLQHCGDVYYVDTDSIICGAYNKKLSIGQELGQWKIEGIGHELCIAGKKLYSMKNKKDGNFLKLASKGVRLTYSEIKAVSGGKAVTHKRDAPNFKIGKTAQFIERVIKST